MENNGTTLAISQKMLYLCRRLSMWTRKLEEIGRKLTPNEQQTQTADQRSIRPNEIKAALESKTSCFGQ